MKLMEKMLECPVCRGNKAKIVGEKVKLSGEFENKEFLTIPLTVLRCIKCGYYMFFDNTAQFTAEESY